MASLTIADVLKAQAIAYAKRERTAMPRSEAGWSWSIIQLRDAFLAGAGAERSLVDRPSPNALGNEAQAVAGSGAAASATTERLLTDEQILFLGSAALRRIGLMQEEEALSDEAIMAIGRAVEAELTCWFAERAASTKPGRTLCT